MLSELFVRSRAAAQSSPHAQDLAAFAVYLRAFGSSPRSVQRHVRRLHAVLAVSSLPPHPALSASDLRSMFRTWRSKGYSATRRHFCRFLRKHGRWIEAASPVEPRLALMRQHLQELVQLNGLAPATITYDGWALRDFLREVLKPQEDVSSITAARVESFLGTRRERFARRTFHHTVYVIRRFLRYAHSAGALPEPLHEFELPQAFRFEQPPRALSNDHIKALLASIDRTTAAGRRDHAILHLMAVHGLRPGEVAALTVGCIDCGAGTLTVQQSKTRSVLVLPLEALTLKLLQGLVGDCAVDDAPLFAALQPPFGALSAPAVSARFKAHARRSGLPIAASSAYSLRHGFAMRLLAAGVGTKLIGDLMGHRSISSTAAYLRLQTDVLREVALDVPQGVSL